MLVKIAVFTCINCFKCLLNPDFTSINTENVIKRNLKLSSFMVYIFFLTYKRLISAIPKHLKESIKKSK